MFFLAVTRQYILEKNVIFILLHAFSLILHFLYRLNNNNNNNKKCCNMNNQPVKYTFDSSKEAEVEIKDRFLFLMLSKI